MTGNELIQWIHEHQAENMMILSRFGEEYGFNGARELNPVFCKVSSTGLPFEEYIVDEYYSEGDANTILL